MNQIKGRQFSLGDVVVADDEQYDLLHKYLPTQEETDDLYSAFALKVIDQSNSNGKQFVRVGPAGDPAVVVESYSKRWIPSDALCLQPFDKANPATITGTQFHEILNRMMGAVRSKPDPTADIDKAIEQILASKITSPADLPVIEVHSLEELEALLDGKTPGMFIIKSSLLKDTPLDPDPEARTRFNGCGYVHGIGPDEPTTGNESLGGCISEICSQFKRRFVAWRKISKAKRLIKRCEKLRRDAAKFGVAV